MMWSGDEPQTGHQFLAASDDQLRFPISGNILFMVLSFSVIQEIPDRLDADLNGYILQKQLRKKAGK